MRKIEWFDDHPPIWAMRPTFAPDYHLQQVTMFDDVSQFNPWSFFVVPGEKPTISIPIGSMYGIFTYIWVIYGVNVGKYSIHGAYGI